MNAAVVVAWAAVLLWGWRLVAAQPLADAEAAAEQTAAHGATLYEQRCAVCHDNAKDRVPPRQLLGFRSPNAVARTLVHGVMRPMAEGLSTDDITALVTFLTGRAPRAEAALAANRCAHAGEPVSLSSVDWPVIGRDIAGSRFQSETSLRAEDLPHLKLKWAFAYPEGASGPVQVAGGRVFLASGDGRVHSLDAHSGCSYWSFETSRVVRAVTVASLPANEGSAGQTAVFFGDDQGAVTALDATSGSQLWKTAIETHPLARITAPPSVHEGRVFVPVSGMEDPLTHDPSYPCCTHRGSVAALDASSGELLWKSYTIEEAPKPRPKASVDSPQYFGPAGGSVYTPLGVDVRRGLVYAATAEAYDRENPPGAYAVIAFDMQSGARRWRRQFMPAEKDRTRICREAGESDCRNMFSMSTQVMVHTLADGKEILLVGSKWGWMYALDPDAEGRTLWSRKVGKGGDLGGIMYGPSADTRTLYVPIADTVLPPERAGGLAALDLATGKLRWQIESEPPACSWQVGEPAACANANVCDCSGAKVAATTAIPGAVFAGGWDGHVRAYSTVDGRLLWDVDTAVPASAVNGVEARGGQVGGYPVVVSGGAVYITSGASVMGRPGNALLVYAVEDGNAAVQASETEKPLKLDPAVLAGEGLREVPPVPKEFLLSGVSRPRERVLHEGDEIVAAVYEEAPVKLPLQGKGMPYDEFVHVLEGTLILTDSNGRTREFNAGDFLLIPKGFTGTWETRGKFRELIVVERNAWDAARESSGE